MILQDIINIIEAAAPLHAQELWDNSGLQLGERNANINAALLTVDVTESVVDEAIMKGCDLIVSHHPLFFLPIKQLVGETMQQRCALKAIRNNIAIYSAHTSLDNAPTGVSHHMAKVLGMVDCKVLVANPMDATLGSGVIGDLQEAMSPKQFVEYVAEVFACDKTPVRYSLGKQSQIKKVALCGGAGADFIDAAIRSGADAYLSADIKYHQFQQADERITIVDIDHWTSEKHTRDYLDEILRPYVQTYISETDSTPVNYLK